MEADALKERFDWDFWVENRACYALGLDGAGRRVDSLASRVEHPLWCGIAPVESRGPSPSG